MTDLQLAMIGVGAALVAGVAVYNVVQERRARKRAEAAFGNRPPDALFEAGARREPSMRPLPDEPPAVIVKREVHAPAPESVPAADLEAELAPSAEISNRIDTIAVILADDPVRREELEPLIAALRSPPGAIHIEGIVDEQWHPIQTSPRQSWRELRVGLQLASRAGPLGEEAVESFNRAVADFAAGINAVSQREAPSSAAKRARQLDQFCADVDIEVAINVVGQSGATFALTRVKSLGLDHGMSETAAGALVRFSADGAVDFVIRRYGDDPAKPPTTYAHGLTFALDVPQVRDAPAALSDMIKAAQVFAQALGGQLVDDNRRPLTDTGLASIRRSLEKVFHEMEEHGIPAGSALARRLFS